MKILFVGDVFGDIGRRVLAEKLADIKDEFSIDFTIANGENCAGGRGITPNYAKKLRKYGVDVITGGNHSSAQLEVFQSEAFSSFVIRPQNIHDIKDGQGFTIVTLESGTTICVINVLGRTFIRGKNACPFKAVEAMLEEQKENAQIFFVDFHAEATSEKVCMAHLFDGKLSALIGTHTHVQTADARIFPKGTAFLTDAGMTGPEFSAIGMQHEPVLDRIMTGTPRQFVQSKEGPMFNGVVIDIDEETGKARSIESILRRYEFDE